MRDRRLEGPLLPLVARLNEVRRAHPALTAAGVEALTWLETENDHLLGFARLHGDDMSSWSSTSTPARPTTASA